MEAHKYNSVREYTTNATDAYDDNVVPIASELIDLSTPQIIEIVPCEGESKYEALVRGYKRLGELATMRARAQQPSEAIPQETETADFEVA